MKSKLNITEVNISDLNLAKYNPCKLDAKQEADLIESIKRFGRVTSYH